jgi:hypothetical protein
LITNEEFGPKETRANREGRSGPGRGCLSKKKLEEKGPKSADITIHEWLHTLEGQEICGRRIPCVDSSEGHQFECKDVNGKKCWHYWYKYILRPPD